MGIKLLKYFQNFWGKNYMHKSMRTHVQPLLQPVQLNQTILRCAATSTKVLKMREKSKHGTPIGNETF